MTRARYIWHVALGAGQGTAEPRDAVTDEVLAVGRAHIERALAKPAGDPIPGRPDYVMSARTQAGALLCFVGRGDVALATFGVATKSRHASALWQVLHHGRAEFASTAAAVPAAPYCAVRAELGLSGDLAVGHWIDGYQLAVAWSWLER